jgi:alkanesulfonate monooxygenase SsuD/methylene tetrahydromethanopterin reductase-like flavin-dependent oxidoreductase (luciferase family)
VSLPVPIGLNPTTIGVTAGWWLAAAGGAEAAGLTGVWAWDHFISRGRRTDPVLECWTILTAAAAITPRIRIGSFMTNVMNRHPAVLARALATLADIAPGRVDLGIGIGGYAAELQAYGIRVPDPSERSARLEEAVAVIRLLLAGGPVDHEGRFYRLAHAMAFPVPQPPPRIVVAGQTQAGARLAARVGDAWSCPSDRLDRLLPVYREALAGGARRGGTGAVIVGVDAGAVLEDAAGTIGGLVERGADEVVVEWLRPDQLDGVLEALERLA